MPHDFVHVVHALKPDTTQCTAHACVLQARVSARCGQASPPLLGCDVMDLDLAWVFGTLALFRRRLFLLPCGVGGGAGVGVVHELVHVVQAPQSEKAQFVGHACVLQAWVSCVCAQGWPPLSACVTTVRERV